MMGTMHEVLTEAFVHRPRRIQPHTLICHHGQQIRRRDPGNLLSTLLNTSPTHPPQKELSQFIEQEQSHARVQESIHKMTSMCWDKCLNFTPTFTKQTNNSLSGVSPAPLQPVSLVQKSHVFRIASTVSSTRVSNWSSSFKTRETRLVDNKFR